MAGTSGGKAVIVACAVGACVAVAILSVTLFRSPRQGLESGSEPSERAGGTRESPTGDGADASGPGRLAGVGAGPATAAVRGNSVPATPSEPSGNKGPVRARHPADALASGYPAGRTPVRFDSSCSHLPERLRATPTLEGVVREASGLEGTAFLPAGERILQFQFGWTDTRGNRASLGLRREQGSPAFYSVTFIGSDAPRPGAIESADDGSSDAAGTDAPNTPEAFTGSRARTVFMRAAMERLRTRVAALPAGSTSGPRVLLVEKATTDGDGALVSRQAKFLDGKVHSYFEPGLACALADGRGEDSWAACICQAR